MIVPHLKIKITIYNKLNIHIKKYTNKYKFKIKTIMY